MIDPFEIIFVCTGNRARSPLAAALLSRRLDLDATVVRSVGTLDLGPVPPLPEAVRAGLLVGVAIASHRATPLRPAALVDADLVVGFEPGHVSAAVVDGGARRDRVFSILELVEILGRIEAEGVLAGTPADTRRVVAQANALRTGSFLSAPAIPDPWGRPQREFDQTAEQIDGLVTVIAHALAPPMQADTR